MTGSVREGRLRSFDGTGIATFRQGERGRWLLLANGLGGSVEAWVHQLAHFRDRVRFVTWDYRSLYKSGPAQNRSFTIEDHVRDARAVMDEHGVEDAVLIGWSMGVQVALEIYRQMPDRVAALVLTNGTNGKPLDQLFGSRRARWIHGGLRLAGKLTRRVQPAIAPVAGLPATIRLMKASGLVADSLDEDVFHRLSGEFAKLDFTDYMETFVELSRHDAREILPAIRVPTLVFVGGKDFMTPPWMGTEMARAIPGAELTVVPGASHYTCVEYPDLFNFRLERFLAEHGLL
ncbi:MAG: alpha/beta fold hydrolase [Deltaproteobacteria bacterium]|nr:alpha/beta fold hydrolase [Deltaproteobacteria bacterium]